jgi:ribosomal protein L11 methyltransferase
VALAALVLQLDSGGADRLSETLLESGALSVTLEEALPSMPSKPDSPGGEVSAPWPAVQLTVLCRAEDGPDRILLLACRAAGIPVPDHKSLAVLDENWVEKSRAGFSPIRVSNRLWVVPSWHDPPDPGAINLVLDPGLAFGTGSHPSTLLCLQWLERNIRGDETVIDYGCGSGILAIAALKLGAHRAIGVDIDPDAIVAARSNARRNQVAAEFLDGRERLSIMADIVVANILASPLQVLAPFLASRCVPGGLLALAGILPVQACEVEQTYAPWIRFGAKTESEGWVCLSGVRQ